MDSRQEAVTVVGAPECSEGERGEPSRNGGAPTTAGETPGRVASAPKERPDPEFSGKARRRVFSANYKLRVLRETDACSKRGELGAYLRREGLYSSLLVEWRRQREDGVLEALSAKNRGRKSREKDNPLVQENHRLRGEVERLERRLRQAETIIDIQKKISEILGIPLKPTENGDGA